jgi:hypothetical protein
MSQRTPSTTIIIKKILKWPKKEKKKTSKFYELQFISIKLKKERRKKE